MRPALAIHDATHLDVFDTELFGNLALKPFSRRIQRTYLGRLLWRDFLRLPVLRYFVAHIVVVCPEVEVVWVAARWIIAMMKDLGGRIEASICQNVRHAVRHHAPSLEPKPAVALLLDGTCPNPATIGPVYFGPEMTLRVLVHAGGLYRKVGGLD